MFQFAAFFQVDVEPGKRWLFPIMACTSRGVGSLWWIRYSRPGCVIDPEPFGMRRVIACSNPRATTSRSSCPSGRSWWRVAVLGIRRHGSPRSWSYWSLSLPWNRDAAEMDIAKADRPHRLIIPMLEDGGVTRNVLISLFVAVSWRGALYGSSQDNMASSHRLDDTIRPAGSLPAASATKPRRSPDCGGGPTCETPFYADSGLILI